MSSLRHLKAKSIVLKNDIHKVLSIVMPGPENKSLKRTHMGTKSKIGLTYSFSQIIFIKNKHTKTVFMKIEELVINFNSSNWSNLTVLISKIFMEYVPNIRVTEIKAKNLINFKLRSKLNYHNKLDQIYI